MRHGATLDRRGAQPRNSQQLADWYSLSHVVHGLILFAILTVAWRAAAIRTRLVAAVLIEASWEMVENSATIIDRYRAETISWGYSGDSVLNSVGDILFMAIGFGIASKLKARYSIALALALELMSLIAIRDNLTLNVLMLVHPIARIRAWQAG